MENDFVTLTNKLQPLSRAPENIFLNQGGVGSRNHGRIKKDQLGSERQILLSEWGEIHHPLRGNALLETGA